MPETAHHDHPYRHGHMDIAEHISSFRLFRAITKWGSLHVAALILMFTLAFCTKAGIWAGFISALVLVAVGVFFLRSKSPSRH